MKAREKCPCFFLSTNLCRCGFTPPALSARKRGRKKLLHPKVQEARNRALKAKVRRKTKCAFPSRLNRKPSPRPHPRLSTVCPDSRPVRFSPPLPAAVSPSLPGLRLSSGALRPRRSGFPSLGGSGFPGLGRCRFSLVQPGVGAGAWLPGYVRYRGCCAFRGASVPLDTIRNISNILRSQKGTQTF